MVNSVTMASGSIGAGGAFLTGFERSLAARTGLGFFVAGGLEPLRLAGFKRTARFGLVRFAAAGREDELRFECLVAKTWCC
jgi:hypothetical protein